MSTVKPTPSEVIIFTVAVKLDIGRPHYMLRTGTSPSLLCRQIDPTPLDKARRIKCDTRRAASIKSWIPRGLDEWRGQITATPPSDWGNPRANDRTEATGTSPGAATSVKGALSFLSPELKSSSQNLNQFDLIPFEPDLTIGLLINDYMVRHARTNIAISCSFREAE